MQIIPIEQLWASEPYRLNRLCDIVDQVDFGSFVLEARGAQEPESPLQAVESVAVINVRGTITKHPSLFHSLFGGNSSTLLVGEALQSAIADESIKSIMLRIDSPGGSVEGVADLADTIYAARGYKPIFAQIDGIGASAAYWLASQATRVFIGQSDQVGSIGVRAVFYDMSAAFKEKGIRPVVVDTGEFKSAGAPGTEITKEHRAYFQSLVDAYMESFTAAVKRGRSMRDNEFGAVADGRVWIGQAGVDNGLVDAVQSPGQTLRLMLDGKIPNETVVLCRTRHAEAKVRAMSSLSIPLS